VEQRTPTEAARRGHPYRAFAIRGGLGAAIVTFLLWRFAGRSVLHTLTRESWSWFAGAVCVYIAGQLLSSKRWQLLAGTLGIGGRYFDYIRYYFIGMFTNLFVPGLLGGDAARSIYLGRQHNQLGAAIASAVADRVAGLLGLFWLAAFAAMFLNRDGLPASVTRPVIAIGVLTIIGMAAGPLLVRVIYLLPGALRRAGAEIAPYLHRPTTMVIPGVLSVGLHISLAICQWMLARGLGLSAQLTLFVLVVPIANVAASLPVTFNGLGLRETAYLFLLGMAGVGHDDAIALGLLWFAATMIGGLTGAIAFITTPTPVGPSVSPDQTSLAASD